MDDSPGGQVTRFAAKPSIWWVSVGVLRNTCRGSVTITSVSMTGRQAPGLEWLGATRVRVLTANNVAIPAFWQRRLTAGPWTTTTGVRIDDDTRVQIVGAIRLAATPGPTEPATVPQVTVAYVDATGADGTLTLSPTIAFCTCAPPTS